MLAAAAAAAALAAAAPPAACAAVAAGATPAPPPAPDPLVVDDDNKLPSPAVAFEDAATEPPGVRIGVTGSVAAPLPPARVCGDVGVRADVAMGAERGC